MDERLDAEGGVVRPLDAESAARADAGPLMTTGIRAIAIAGLHGYLNPAHEERVGRDGATDRLHAGVGQLRRCPALAKLVGRGDTTVVDAYLSARSCAATSIR